MSPVCLHDKVEIEAFLRRNTHLHLYELGDLDDFFWQYTTWYALKQQGQIEALFLVYSGTSLPVLVATGEGETSALASLLQSAMPLLPRRFYAHFSPGLASLFESSYRLQSHGPHFKMALTRPEPSAGVDTSRVVPLSPSDLEDLEKLYAAGYPGNFFDARMLETGCYYGIRKDEDILSVAGIHVFSRDYKVAALGNITTHPDHRGRGLGSAVTAKLCQALLQQVDHIGLNVKTNNHSAIACYRKLGFEWVANYEEYSLEAK